MLIKTVSIIAFIILIIFLIHLFNEKKESFYDNVYNLITNNVNLQHESVDLETDIHHSSDEESEEESTEENQLDEETSDEEELLKSLTENKNNFNPNDKNEQFQNF